MRRPRRYRDVLRTRWRAIFAYAGLIWIVAGVVVLLPLAVVPFARDEARLAWAFLAPGIVTVAAGLVVWRRLRRQKEPVPFTVTEGAATVVIGWLVAVVAAAVPFALVLPLPFGHAIFEATSGWTTTGLTVVDVARAPKVILLLRSLLQLAGGAGLAILMLSVMRGPTGPGLPQAEGRGEQLVPHVARSVRLVLRIYVVYNVVGILALRLAGMGWFDAVNHAFTSLSTGGFSTRAGSIGAFHSAAIEGVVMVLMIVGSLNFLTAWTLMRGRFLEVSRNGELRLTAVVLPAAVVALLFAVTLPLYEASGKAVRVAFFEAISALTTTGFTSVNEARWPDLGWLVLILLMIVGGGTGSTAGGLKQARVWVLWRSLTWEIRTIFLPRTTVNRPQVWHGDRRVAIRDADVRRVGVYAFLYLLAFFLGSAVIAAYGTPLRSAMFDFASALGTVGLSVGVTSPTAPPGVLWTEIAGMFLGRLEFLAVIVGLRRIVGDAWGWVRG